MKNEYLIVVDMQNDFIDGALGSKEAQAIVPGVIEAIKGFKGEVIYTRDTHHSNYLQTQEGRMLPVEHCFADTPGWQLYPAIDELAKGHLIIDKDSFGPVTLPRYMKEKGEPDTIVVLGLCTDYCVLVTAILMKAHFPEAEIFVDARNCAATLPENHEPALKTMETCQIHILR